MPAKNTADPKGKEVFLMLAAEESLHQDYLKQQAAPFEPLYHLGQRVEKLERRDDGRWALVTSKGTEIRAQAVIVAAGVGAFGPHRPPIEGIEDYEESGAVRYMVTRRFRARLDAFPCRGG